MYMYWNLPLLLPDDREDLSLYLSVWQSKCLNTSINFRLLINFPILVSYIRLAL